MPTSYSQYGNSGSANIDYGSYAPNGLRVGPQLNNSQVYDENASASPFYKPRLNSGVFGQSLFGNGVPVSPIFTYNINVFNYVSNLGADPSKIAISNIVGDGTAAIPAKTSFTINQSPFFSSFNQVPFANIDVGNPIGYQMDWPRSVGVLAKVTITTTLSIDIQVSGYDWYGNKMTEIITVALGPTAVVWTRFGSSTKAFYLVTKATLLTEIPAANACQLLLCMGNSIGLPYRLFAGSFINGVYCTFAPVTTPASYISAISVPSTAKTSDVRGRVDINSFGAGNVNVRVTYYVRGADAFQNQAAALQLPTCLASNSDPVPTPELKLSDLYGVPQYYDPQDF